MSEIKKLSEMNITEKITLINHFFKNDISYKDSSWLDYLYDFNPKLNNKDINIRIQKCFNYTITTIVILKQHSDDIKYESVSYKKDVENGNVRIDSMLNCLCLFILGEIQND